VVFGMGVALKRLLAVALVIGVVVPASAKSDAQLKVAHKFVDAVRGKQAYSDAGLISPLSEAEKSVLARFAKCTVVTVNHGLRQDPHHMNSFDLSPNQVEVVGDCRGVPKATPAGLTLHFQGNRISSVETTNFDLIPPS
jgi:hypothetical protein